MIERIVFYIVLAIGPRQFFDEEVPGLRYEDLPNEWNRDRQFLDDETPSDSDVSQEPIEPDTIACEGNELV